VRDFFRNGSRGVQAGAILLGAALLVGFAAFAAPQFNTPATISPALPGDQLDRAHVPDDQPYVPRELQARQLKRLREEHQKQVFSDAARLVQLATALKQQVQKGDKVTVDAIKDVDEIGKLAKRLSDRIKTQ
jgi:hypothetical protein